MSSLEPMPGSPSPSPGTGTARRRLRRRVGCVGTGCLLLLVLCCSVSFVVSLFGHATVAAGCVPATSDLVLAGAAKADISPRQPVYLGGYGIGPARLSTGVLQPLYVRAFAIGNLANEPQHTFVFASIDSQGYFAAYQTGPFGIADIRGLLTARFHIPTQNILISSTHSHAAPDTVGFWGGVPESYLQLVHDQATKAISQAVSNLKPARLRVGSASIAGYTSSFGNEVDGGKSWQTDTQIRSLQAVDRSNGRATATLLNVSVHPTALDKNNTLAAPDWPGVTADVLEQQLGGTALIMIGALGHTWPGFPTGVQTSKNSSVNMRLYGTVIAQRALAAVQHAQPITQPTLCVADHVFREVGTSSELLLGLQVLGRQGHERILRSLQAPYFIPPADLGVEVEAVRIGDVAFFAAPVEPYPSLLFALRQQEKPTNIFFFGLTNDDLGYAARLSEYSGALSHSPTDEALFIINPSFGDDILRELHACAQEIGL